MINKVDLVDAETLAERKAALLEALNWKGPIYEISALSHVGTRELSGDLMTYIEGLNQQQADDENAAAAERDAQERMQQEARERINALREQQAAARRSNKQASEPSGDDEGGDEGDDVAVEYRH